MKTRQILPVVVLLLSIFAYGCGNLDSEIQRNRRDLAQLRTGMSKDEVFALMGPPIEGKKYCRPDVWFYYTDCKWSDSMITRDECTPILFENDKVIGWGQDAYKRHILFEPW
jgi:outer membrane protein assembly factor BamE (lipoprotein component of BamABCDE complex)